ncbi:MAG: hypothetical protein R3C25_04405 [Hyphomonadaceae bacterium]
MSAARPASIVDADFVDVGDQRCADRRSNDRRAARLRLDPLFAATLVNHIAKAEAAPVRAYAPHTPKPRAGIVVNLRA